METIDLIRDIPAVYLEVAEDSRKIGLLRTMAESATLTPDGDLAVNWIRPSSFLMRAEVYRAQETADLNPLNRRQGFKKVSRCTRGGT